MAVEIPMDKSKRLFGQLSLLNPSLSKELEACVVNTVKVKMISKLDNLLDGEGRENARKLFLEPLFTISQLQKRVEETAPEMKTFFYKELTDTLDKTEKIHL